MAGLGNSAQGWGTLVGGLGSSLLGGILGNNAQQYTAPTNPYAQTIQNGAATQFGLGQQLSSFGQDNLNQAQAFQPTATNATNAYLQQLQANPYTDQFSAAQRANQVSSINQGYAGQQAQLQSQLSAAGLAQPGGQSSVYSGALTGLGMGQAGAQAQAANMYANNAIQQRYANLSAAANTAQGYAGQLAGYGMQGLGQGASIYGQGLSQLQQLGYAQQNADLQTMGINQQAQQQAASAGGGLGSILGTAASFFGI